MGCTGFLCLSGLTVFALGLILANGPVAMVGLVVLVLGMYIVVVDDD